MMRAFLAVGDEADNGAFITQGLDSASCSDPPPSVQISTLGMSTYCPVCKQEGHIAPRGPRWPGTGPNGMQWALSGDINLCGCSPPHVFRAERKMTMSFTAEEATALMTGPNATTAKAAGAILYDQFFRLTDQRTEKPLRNVPYRIVTDDGEEYEGRTDSQGHSQRVTSDIANEVTLHVFAEETPINPEWDRYL